MQVKEGTLWQGGEDKRFRVISVSEVDGNTWVYYREEPKKYVPAKDCKEYSCFLESFVHRFRSIPE